MLAICHDVNVQLSISMSGHSYDYRFFLWRREHSQVESSLWMLLGRRALQPLQAHESAFPPMKNEEHSGWGCGGRQVGPWSEDEDFQDDSEPLRF